MTGPKFLRFIAVLVLVIGNIACYMMNDRLLSIQTNAVALFALFSSFLIKK